MSEKRPLRNNLQAEWHFGVGMPAVTPEGTPSKEEFSYLLPDRFALVSEAMMLAQYVGGEAIRLHKDGKYSRFTEMRILVTDTTSRDNVSPLLPPEE